MLIVKKGYGVGTGYDLSEVNSSVQSATVSDGVAICEFQECKVVRFISNKLG